MFEENFEESGFSYQRKLYVTLLSIFPSVKDFTNTYLLAGTLV